MMKYKNLFSQILSGNCFYLKEHEKCTQGDTNYSKKNKSNIPSIKIRQIAEKSDEAQEKNKSWWEKAPMTYVKWGESDRELKDTLDFEKVNQKYIQGNSFLNNYDFAAYAGKKILEIGCGAGSASIFFAKNNADVTAIDITEKAIQMTIKNAQFNNVELKIQREDAEKLSFKDNSFDYVYSWGVLHHTQNTEKAIAEVSRVLKPGGKGMIMVYNKFSIRYYYEGLIWLLFHGKIFKGYNLKKVQRFYTDGYYHRHFTAKELKKTLAFNRLITDKITITHMRTKCLPLPLFPKFIDEKLKKLWGWLLVSEFHKSN